MFRYVELADAAINDVISRGKLPVLCGGTHFYLEYLIWRPEHAIKTESKKKDDVGEKKEENSKIDESSSKELGSVDESKHGEDLIPSKGDVDSKIPSWQPRGLAPRGPERSPKYSAIVFCCDPGDILFEKVDRRCDEMLSQGLLDEIRILRKNAGDIGENFDKNLLFQKGIFQAIGVREFYELAGMENPPQEGINL